MLKIRHSRIAREHLHTLSKDRRWSTTQGSYLRVVNLNPAVHTNGIHSTPVYLDNSTLHRPVPSFVNKSIFRVWKQIPVKSLLKRFSSYVDRFKLGWQEDSENVCCTEVIVLIVNAFYRAVLTTKRK